MIRNLFNSKNLKNLKFIKNFNSILFKNKNNNKLISLFYSNYNDIIEITQFNNNNNNNKIFNFLIKNKKNVLQKLKKYFISNSNTNNNNKIDIDHNINININ